MLNPQTRVCHLLLQLALIDHETEQEEAAELIARMRLAVDDQHDAIYMRWLQRASVDLRRAGNR